MYAHLLLNLLSFVMLVKVMVTLNGELLTFVVSKYKYEGGNRITLCCS